MKNNQTAVEWLVEQVNSDCLNSTFIQPNLIEKAKALEKMQIIEAYEQGEAEWCPFEYTSAKDYYKQTFKKNKK